MLSHYEHRCFTRSHRSISGTNSTVCTWSSSLKPSSSQLPRSTSELQDAVWPKTTCWCLHFCLVISSGTEGGLEPIQAGRGGAFSIVPCRGEAAVSAGFISGYVVASGAVKMAGLMRW